MTELRGAPAAERLAEICRADIGLLKQKGVTPRLAIIRVGAREDDLAYERGILKRFASAGAEAEVVALPEDAQQEEFEQTILRLNGDPLVHGILLFRPLPGRLSEQRVKSLIAPTKDIDCMSHQNIAGVFEGGGACYPPCTPQAVMELLDFYGVGLAGKRVTVVGRSMVVGRPLAMLLLAKNATVTLCHTKTLDLPGECRRADIVVACAGHAKLIGREHVRPGQIVVDVGINVADGKLCGDVDFEAVRDTVEAITPVPGGVGGVTAAVLLRHTVAGAKENMKGQTVNTGFTIDELKQGVKNPFYDRQNKEVLLRSGKKITIYFLM